MANATNTTPGSIALSGDLSGSVDPYKPELRPTGVVIGSYGNSAIIVNDEGRVISANTQNLISIVSTYGTADDFPASTSNVGFISIPESGYINVDSNGAISIPLATTSAPGVVRVPTSNGLSVNSNGAINITIDNLPKATTTVYGLVSVPLSGNLNIVSSNGNLTVPIADANTLGVIKTGTNFTVTDGTVAYTPIPATTTTIGGIIVKPQFNLNPFTVVNTDQLTVVYGDLPKATKLAYGFVEIEESKFIANNGLITPRFAATAGNQGIVTVGDGLTVAANGLTTITINEANTTTLGYIKASNTMPVLSDGLLYWNPNNYTDFIASNTEYGFVRVDNSTVLMTYAFRVGLPGTYVDTDINDEYIFGLRYDNANVFVDTFAYSNTTSELVLANTTLVTANAYTTVTSSASIATDGDDVVVLCEETGNTIIKFYTGIPNLTLDETKTLTNTFNFTRFSDIKIDANTCVVGQRDNTFTSVRGRIIIYERTGGVWSTAGIAYTPSSIVYGDSFVDTKNSFDIDGNTIVTCAKNDFGDDPAPIYLGSVYVYERQPNTWSAITKLTPDYEYVGGGAFVPFQDIDDQFYGQVAVANGVVSVLGKENWLTFPTANGGFVVYNYEWNGSAWAKQPSILVKELAPYAQYPATQTSVAMRDELITTRYANNTQTVFNTYIQNTISGLWVSGNTYQQPVQFTDGVLEISPNKEGIVTQTEYLNIDILPLDYEDGWGVIFVDIDNLPLATNTIAGFVKPSPNNYTVITSANNLGLVLPVANVVNDTAGTIFVDGVTLTVNTNGYLNLASANGNTFGVLVGNASGDVIITDGFVSCDFNTIPRLGVIDEADVNVYDKGQSYQPVVANTAANVEPDFANSNIFIYTLTTNTHFEQPNTSSIPDASFQGSYVLILKQDSVGGRVATWDSYYAFDQTPILSTDPDAVDVVFITHQQIDAVIFNGFSILTKNYS